MPRTANGSTESKMIAQIFRSLVAQGLQPISEWTVNVSRKPLRYRQVDLRCIVNEREVWIDVDGPNHRGTKNQRRDAELAEVAEKHGARLIHWPLWMLVTEGTDALVKAILDGKTMHLGHADALGYVTWRSEVYGQR